MWTRAGEADDPPDEEVKAVQIMSSAMRATPASYTLLHAQVDFLRSKGKFDWALKLARQAVNCAPSEFVTWEKITEVYIDLGEYESVSVRRWTGADVDAYVALKALLTLNSCPMFTFNGRDQHRALTPARVHLPSKPAVLDILPQRVKTEDDEVRTLHPAHTQRQAKRLLLRLTRLCSAYLRPDSAGPGRGHMDSSHVSCHTSAGTSC
jgi:hypothetical protein